MVFFQVDWCPCSCCFENGLSRWLVLQLLNFDHKASCLHHAAFDWFQLLPTFAPFHSFLSLDRDLEVVCRSEFYVFLFLILGEQHG